MFTRWFVVLPVILFSSGCTHCVLEENTLRASSTLSSFQTQQVLDNLARLECDQAANPCHLTLSTGLVQAADQAAATLLGSLFSSGLSSVNSFNPAMSAQRGVVEQWSVNPVTDGEQLETLRIAYRKALYPSDPQIDDLIVNQIIGLSVRFSLLPKVTTIKRILDHKRKDNKAYETLVGIVAALTAETRRLDDKMAQMKDYVQRLQKDRPKDAYDIEMQILDLQEKKSLRRAQKAVLLDLAGFAPVRSPGNLLPLRIRLQRHTPHGITHAEASEMALFILSAFQARPDAAPGYLPATDLIGESTRNPAAADQAEDQIARLESLLDDEKFKGDWIQRGCKKDVPHGACYVGHFRDCRSECYLWVAPEQYEILREFTQIILTLAAPGPASEFPALGPAFSPGLR
jgi:hypothetical protein